MRISASEVANGKKTAVVKKSLNPEWHEHFQVAILGRSSPDSCEVAEGTHRGDMTHIEET